MLPVGPLSDVRLRNENDVYKHEMVAAAQTEFEGIFIIIDHTFDFTWFCLGLNSVQKIFKRLFRITRVARKMTNVSSFLTLFQCEMKRRRLVFRALMARGDWGIEWGE